MAISFPLWFLAGNLHIIDRINSHWQAHPTNENQGEELAFQRKETLQDPREAHPSQLLARGPSQHGLLGMLPGNLRAVTQQASVRKAWRADPASSLVVRVSQDRLLALFQSSRAQKAFVRETRSSDSAERMAKWTPFHGLQPLSKQPSRISGR
jgi:hypothetical protein